MATSKIPNIVANESGYCQIGKTLICYGMVYATLAAGASEETTATFPRTYSASPIVVVSPLTQQDYDYDFAYVKARSTGSATITLVNKYAGNNSLYGLWIAIGQAS